MKTIPFLAVFLFLGTYAYGGGGAGDSGGGDNVKPESGSAWFLGNDVIQYCAEIDTKFGVPKEDVLPYLTNAFKVWHDYIGIHHTRSTKNLSTYEDLRLATRSHLKENCDGKEDVKFYFGGTNQEIEKIKTLYDDPSGFAHRSSYDQEKGWGKGFVWIAPSKSIEQGRGFPNWNSPYTLHGILLHEIGHLYGCQHIEGTIMSAKISDFIRWAQQYPQFAYANMTTIDLSRTLLPTLSPITHGIFGGKGGKPEENALLFEKLVGVKTQHSVVAQFILKTEGPSELVLSDGQTTQSLIVRLPKMDVMESSSVSPLSIFIGDGETFRAFIKKKDAVHVSLRVPIGMTSLGTIQSKAGKEYPLSLELNAFRVIKGGPLFLKIFIEGESRILFTQNASQESILERKFFQK